RDFFFQAEDGIRHFHVTGVQTCALPILLLVIPLIVFFRIKNREPQPAMKISSLKPFKGTESYLSSLKPLLFIFRILALGFFIIVDRKSVVYGRRVHVAGSLCCDQENVDG